MERQSITAEVIRWSQMKVETPVQKEWLGTIEESIPNQSPEKRG